jgi:hypothetical protein
VARFTLSFVCRYFADRVRNPSASFSLSDAFYDYCEAGLLEPLKHWCHGDKRPKSLEYVAIAAFHGHLSIVQWFYESKSALVKPQLVLLNAIFNNQIEVVKWLLANGFVINPLCRELALTRGSNQMADLICQNSKTTFGFDKLSIRGILYFYLYEPETCKSVE